GLTITNTSGSSVTGAFAVRLSGLTAGVTLQSATVTVGGVTYDLVITHDAAGNPIINVPPALASKCRQPRTKVRQATGDLGYTEPSMSKGVPFSSHANTKWSNSSRLRQRWLRVISSCRCHHSRSIGFASGAYFGR